MLNTFDHLSYSRENVFAFTIHSSIKHTDSNKAAKLDKFQVYFQRDKRFAMLIIIRNYVINKKEVNMFIHHVYDN